MHSMDDVTHVNTKLDIFDQFDKTYSWVDELLEKPIDNEVRK